jgi:hypothetical protein
VNASHKPPRDGAIVPVDWDHIRVRSRLDFAPGVLAICAGQVKCQGQRTRMEKAPVVAINPTEAISLMLRPEPPAAKLGAPVARTLA